MLPRLDTGGAAVDRGARPGAVRRFGHRRGLAGVERSCQGCNPVCSHWPFGGPLGCGSFDHGLLGHAPFDPDLLGHAPLSVPCATESRKGLRNNLHNQAGRGTERRSRIT